MTIPTTTPVQDSHQAFVARLVIDHLPASSPDPIRDAGYSNKVSCHARATSAYTIRRGGGKHAIETRIEIEVWLRRPLFGQDEWSRRLTRSLAKDVVRQWKELGGPPRMGQRKLDSGSQAGSSHRETS